MLLILLRFLFQALVEVCATFMAAVLSHEHVQAAGSSMMVRAMNEFLRQPDLNEHVRCMSETMAKNQEDYARSAGQDFPKLAGRFIEGMLSPKKESKQQQQQQQDKMTTTTTTAAAAVAVVADKNGIPTTTNTTTMIANGSTHSAPPSTTASPSTQETNAWPVVETLLARNSKNNNNNINTKTAAPTKSNSFLSIPALGGLPLDGGLRQRLGSGARAS